MKKKICFIVTKSEVGGAQKWIKEQILILDEEFEVYIATNEPGWLIENKGIKSTLLSKNIEKRISIKFLLEFRNFLKLNRIDLIVASSANGGIYGRLMKFFLKTKVVYVSHGWSAIYNGGKFAWIFKKVEYILSLWSDSILCVSKSDYKNAKISIKVHDKKLKLIENKIIPMLRKENSKVNEIPKILAVTRLAPPKRLDLLIESVKGIQCKLYIIGDGTGRKELEEFSKKKSVENVYFKGEIKGFKEFYKYDIFALISDSEGLPMSALEAMSAGLPLLLSNVGGCSELIEGNGVLTKNNINDIKISLKKIIKEKEKMMQRSSELFDEKFNLKLNKDEYIKYYKKII